MNDLDAGHEERTEAHGGALDHHPLPLSELETNSSGNIAGGHR